jgi:hypothetical protein
MLTMLATVQAFPRLGPWFAIAAGALFVLACAEYKLGRMWRAWRRRNDPPPEREPEWKGECRAVLEVVPGLRAVCVCDLGHGGVHESNRFEWGGS